jgi:hypothetical protein
MVTVCFFKTLVSTYESTRRRSLEEHNIFTAVRASYLTDTRNRSEMWGSENSARGTSLHFLSVKVATSGKQSKAFKSVSSYPATGRCPEPFFTTSFFTVFALEIS